MIQFKEVKGYKGLSVSTCGRVFCSRLNRELAVHTTGNGYRAICYKRTNKCKSKIVRLHRLVGLAYIDNPEGKPYINHIDSNRKNNTISNLEWCTHSENMLHAYKYGNKEALKGSSCPSSVYTDCQIKEVCRMLYEGYRQVDIAKATGVHKVTICEVKRGVKWVDISKEYFENESNIPKKSNKLSIETVKCVCNKLSQGVRPIDISNGDKKFYMQIIRIKTRDTYQDISKDYKW